MLGEGVSKETQMYSLEKDGFVVISLPQSDSLIDNINLEIDQLVKSGKFRTNSSFYSYNESPRIVESWKHSSAATRLAFHPQIITVLADYFKAIPRPFSTINFLHSTQQPLHSDFVHFGTVPAFHLAAAWVALEDIHPDSGPIQVVPGSHRWPEFVYSQLGLPIARSLGDVARHYRAYEQWVLSDLKARNAETISPRLKKGDAIIWLANLLHGSPDCVNVKLSRKSQVTHYHTDQVTLHYNPAFSSPSEGRFLRRNMEYLPV